MAKKKEFTPQARLKALALLSEAKKADKLETVQSKLQVALNKTRTETFQNRVYEIYQATMLKEMVLHGNGPVFDRGPSFMPADSLEDTAFLWSDVPILVNHPDFALGIENYALGS